MPLANMASFKFAVIGDVHSNALALKACLQSIYEYEASNSPIDSIVFMGDLLTYGVRPNETLCAVSEVVASRDVKLILGNHDQLYIDLFGNSDSQYFEQLPAWIQETVQFHIGTVDKRLFSSLPFLSHYAFLGVLFSHANFFFLDSVKSDWSYVNTHADHCRQIEILSQNKFRLGVLGHTHRPRLFSQTSGAAGDSVLRFDGDQTIMLYLVHILVPLLMLVPLSPRDKLLSNYMELVELDQHGPVGITYIPYVYDRNSHLRDLACSNLTPYSLQKLTSFFKYS